MARGLLESHGIPAVVADEHSASLNSHMPFAIGGVRLQVPDGLAEQAQAILAELQGLDETTIEESMSVGYGSSARPPEPLRTSRGGATIAQDAQAVQAPAYGVVAEGLASLRTCPHCGLLVRKPQRSRFKYVLRVLLATFLPIRIDDDGPQIDCQACGMPLDGARRV